MKQLNNEYFNKTISNITFKACVVFKQYVLTLTKDITKAMNLVVMPCLHLSKSYGFEHVKAWLKKWNRSLDYITLHLRGTDCRNLNEHPGQCRSRAR